MYAAAIPPRRVAVPNQSKNMWPLASIVCFGCLGFLVAATIVLALIPLYLPTKDVVPSDGTNATDIFYLRYDASGNASTSLTGTLVNLGDVEKKINQAIGLTTDTIEIKQAFSQTAFVRRKREHRMKRNIVTKFLLECQVKYRKTCVGTFCLNQIRNQVFNAIKKTNNIANVPVQISNREFGTKSSSEQLTFIELTFTKPEGFGMEPIELRTFVAIRSGYFNDALTWKDKVLPYGSCKVMILPGVQVILNRDSLNLNMTTCYVNGTLILGSSNTSSFKFIFPINIVVNPGGNLIEQTSKGVVNIPRDGVITIYPGGSFLSGNTTLVADSSSRNLDVQSRQVAIGGNIDISFGFTFGVLLGGSSLHFFRVFFIVRITGDFSVVASWLGFIIPSQPACRQANGCGVCVHSGSSLSTGSLNNAVNIQISIILVEVSAIIEIGTPGLNGGFQFVFAVTLNIYGICAEVTGTGGGIYVPVLTNINIFLGGRFTSLVATILIVWDPITGNTIGIPYFLGVLIEGPFFLSVLANGTIIVSTTTPGGVDSGSTTTIGTSEATVSTVTVPTGLSTETSSVPTATTTIFETITTTTAETTTTPTPTVQTTITTTTPTVQTTITTTTTTITTTDHDTSTLTSEPDTSTTTSEPDTSTLTSEPDTSTTTSEPDTSTPPDTTDPSSTYETSETTTVTTHTTGTVVTTTVVTNTTGTVATTTVTTHTTGTDITSTDTTDVTGTDITSTDTTDVTGTDITDTDTTDVTSTDITDVTGTDATGTDTTDVTGTDITDTDTTDVTGTDITGTDTTDVTSTDITDVTGTDATGTDTTDITDTTFTSTFTTDTTNTDVTHTDTTAMHTTDTDTTFISTEETHTTNTNPTETGDPTTDITNTSYTIDTTHETGTPPIDTTHETGTPPIDTTETIPSGTVTHGTDQPSTDIGT